MQDHYSGRSFSHTEMKQREKVLQDPLTDLPNREAYNHYLKSAFNRWQRYNEEWVLALADIDNFKHINDTYGYLAGDVILAKISKLFKHTLRVVDFISRYDGQKFVILLEKTPLESAQTVMEKLRQTIASTHFQFEGKTIKSTTSFGLTEFRNGDTVASIFERANKGLYEAKTSGRNKVVIK